MSDLDDIRPAATKNTRRLRAKAEGDDQGNVMAGGPEEMTWRAQLWNNVIANPFAWFLLVAFVAAEYGNWRLGEKLDRVCELTGRHDFAVTNPRTDREELDNICVERESEMPADQ